MADIGWPDGGLTLPPPLAAKKRKIERAAVDCLSASGFSPIELPTLEYVSSNGADDEDRCKFLAPDGRLLGLRYDHTSSLIRFVAANENMKLPARLFYSGPVFRRKKMSGGYSETAQIGAEILGVDGVAADIEIVRVLAKTLQAAGVTEFLIDIGTVEVFKGLMAGTKIDPKQVAAIRDDIHRKDDSSLRKTLLETDLSPAKKIALGELPSWFGGSEVFEKALKAVDNDRSRKGLEHLQEAYRALAAPESKGGLGKKISVDMGVVHSLDYYTGAVFEAYAPRVGRPIASGGRYDNLAEIYGKSISATGFALNVGLILDIVD